MSKYELTLLALIVNNMSHFMTSQKNKLGHYNNKYGGV